jgi:hypothetical protein
MDLLYNQLLNVHSKYEFFPTASSLLCRTSIISNTYLEHPPPLCYLKHWKSVINIFITSFTWSLHNTKVEDLGIPCYWTPAGETFCKWFSAENFENTKNPALSAFLNPFCLALTSLMFYFHFLPQEGQAIAGEILSVCAVYFFLDVFFACPNI